MDPSLNRGTWYSRGMNGFERRDFDSIRPVLASGAVFVFIFTFQFYRYAENIQLDHDSRVELELNFDLTLSFTCNLKT